MLVHNLPQEHNEIELVVFSDMHVGDPLFNEDLFKQYRDWVLAQPNRFCILNGDIMNTATKDSVSDVYGDVMSPAEQLRWCKKEFEPLKDRILAITEGNHEARITKSTSIRVMESLAEHLGIPDRFHPDGVLLKLTFGKDRHSKRAAFTAYVTHGRGGGALEGAKALRMARMANVVLCDIYVMSHTHWKAAFKQSIWVPDVYNKKVRLLEQTFVNSSSLVDWGGYAQVQGHKPGALGSPHITLRAEPRQVLVTL